MNKVEGNCSTSKTYGIAKQYHFIAVGFINALVNALFLPVLSLYAHQYFSASPIEISVFLGLFACMSVAYTHFLSALGEQKSQLKSIAIAVCILALFAFWNLSFIDVFWFAFVFVVIIFATFQCLSAVIMGLAHSNFPREDMPSINAKLVAATAAAWVFGPSISFMVVKHESFTLLFYGLCVIVILLLMLIFFVPYQIDGIASKSNTRNNFHSVNLARNKEVLSIVILIIVASFSVALYQHLLPIYFTRENLDIRYIGWAFTCAALIEVGVILSSNRLAIRVGFRKTFLLAMTSGLLFFVLLPFTTQTLFFLLALQIFKAVFYGLVSGSGINWLQSKRPDEPIFSATLFHNGLVIGSLLAGFASGFAIFALPTHTFFMFNGLILAFGIMYLFLRYSETTEGFSSIQSGD